MTRFLRNYIDGRWVASRSTEFEEVMNPATEEALANVPLSSKAETAEAVKAADAAFQTWKKVPVPVRGRYLFKLHQLLTDHKSEFGAFDHAGKWEIIVRVTGRSSTRNRKCGARSGNHQFNDGRFFINSGD
ncbi:hypothetical protein EfmAA818_27710 [Enterococcus faecium]|nr:hypothetical protein EfmAA818_27710 [Enterococcus faecium]